MNVKHLSAFMLLIVLMTPAIALAQTPQEDACYRVGGFISPDSGICEIHSGVTIDIDYPFEYLLTPFAQQTVDTFIADYRTQFLNSFVMAGDYPGPNPWGLTMEYALYNYSSQISSLELTIYEYAGAHGNTSYQTFTFDLDNQRQLTLDDVLDESANPLAMIAPIAQQQITETLGDFVDSTWLEQGTSPDPVNYVNWVVTPDSIIFIFPPYQVAAYAAGTQRVEIPFSQLTGVLKAPFAQP